MSVDTKGVRDCADAAQANGLPHLANILDEAADELDAARARIAELEAVVAKLNDNEIADRVGRDCHDNCHDARYCGTCEVRLDGIYAYREQIQAAAAQAASKENKP